MMCKVRHFPNHGDQQNRSTIVNVAPCLSVVLQLGHDEEAAVTLAETFEGVTPKIAGDWQSRVGTILIWPVHNFNLFGSKAFSKCIGLK